MAREAKPCPFYGMSCEYVPMAEKADAAAARIEQLEAALREIASDDLDYASGSGHESAILTARAALGEKA